MGYGIDSDDHTNIGCYIRYDIDNMYIKDLGF